MGRASKEEARRTRARIVARASEMFRASGADRVSVADVMGALGLTNGGFYKHFASKDALVAEATALSFEQASMTWKRIVEAAPDAQKKARVERLVDHYFLTRPAHRRCPMIALAPHVAHAAADNNAREEYQKGVSRLFEQFAATPDSGGSSPSLVRQNNAVLFAAMIGAETLSEAIGDTEWTKALRAAVKDAAKQRQS